MVYTVTLNPALDYILRLPYVGSEDINRAETAQILYGGKGIYVSLVLSRLGVDNVALGFAAGFTGNELERLLREDGYKTDFVHTKEGITRINVKIFAQEQFDVNAPGPNVTEEDVEALYEKLDKLTEGDVLILSGAIPPNVPSNTYEEILKRLEGRGIRFVVDAEGEILLKALAYKPFLIKPNHHEISAIFNDDVKKTDDEKIVKYAKELQKMGAVNVLVSRGGAGATLVDENGDVFTLGVYPGGPCVNNVGCGDSMVGGFVAGYERKQDYDYAFRLGSSAGNATAYCDGIAQGEAIEEIYNNYFSEQSM
jgi:1-phosphofructokinase